MSIAEPSTPHAGPAAPAERPVRATRGAALVLFSAYAIAIVLLVLSGVIDFRNARELEESTAGVSRTLEAIERLRTVGNAVFFAESAARGFVITGDPGYLAPYRDMQQRIPVRLAEAGATVSDTPTQRAAMSKLREQAGQKFVEMSRVVDAQRGGGHDAAVAAFLRSDSIATTSAVRETIGGMLAEESRTLGEKRVAAFGTYRNGLIRSLVATTVVGLALTAFYLLMVRYLRQRDSAFRTVAANNTDLEQRVHDRTADLSNLSRHLLEVREEEKRVIARDLHDDFGSYLTAINMDVSRARDRIAATHPEQAQKLERTLGLLNSAIEMKRQLISELRPSILDHLGLGAALEQYVEEWSRRSGIAATFDFDGELTSDEKGCPIAIFRVFQEALANVSRHAEATRVASSAFRVDDRIEFEITDDGIGISDAARHRVGTHGLLGIRERILAYRGTLEILAGPRNGTIVRGSMPCTCEPAEAAAVAPHLA